MKRLPILLWGDLVHGQEPVLRRALAGNDAHECMYAWVYLTEFLALSRLREAKPSLETLANLDAWPGLDRARIDRLGQIGKEGFHLMTAAIGSGAERIVELGSTFGAAIVKHDILAAALGAPAVRWTGIDNSPFMHDTTRLIGDGRFDLISDWRDAPGDAASVLLSRFVASYVLQSTEALADYAASFGAVVIEDAFAASDMDTPVYNHGQPETFYSLTGLHARLSAKGLKLYRMASYPDFPAGSARCHVIKLFAATDPAPIIKALETLGFPTPEPITPDTLRALNTAVSEERWGAVEQAKQRSPVWGPTPDDFTVEPAQTRFTRWLRDLSNPWRKYRLHGDQARQAIERATG